jgi:hypothetical protein
MMPLDKSDPRQRQLGRLILAKADIKQARNATHLLISNTEKFETVVGTALKCSIVICYSRPFIARKEFPAIPDKFKKFTDKNLQDLHNLLIEQRNCYDAHRDEDLNAVSIIRRGSKVTWDAGRQHGALAKHGTSIRSRAIYKPAFEEAVRLFDFQLDRLESAISSQLTKLFG